MASAERGTAFLDSFAQKGGVIDGSNIDWEKYLHPEDASRIIPVESLADKAKARLMLGAEQEDGLTLPWSKTHGRVLVRPGKLVVWAGWTHHGKTQMVKQVMLHGVGSGEKVLIASMEEEVIDVYADLAGMACANPQPSPREFDRFNDFVTAKMWLYDQQGQTKPERIQAVIAYAAKNFGITQAVVDSLMMLAVDRDDYEAQARFVGQLKTTAKDHGVTIHLVAHMRKREGRGGDESPGTAHDISGGHEIASKADYVFLPWRDKKPNARPACQLKVEKQRGRINWLGIIDLNFHAGSRQFVEDVHPMKFWSDEQAF